MSTYESHTFITNTLLKYRSNDDVYKSSSAKINIVLLVYLSIHLSINAPVHGLMVKLV